MSSSIGNIFYEESRLLEEEDIGHESNLYEINLYDRPFLISIGKERKIAEKPHTYYFPVYLMNGRVVQLQIGAFRYESREQDRLKHFLDKKGELDLNLMGELDLYHFADYDYFTNSPLSVTPQIIADLEKEEKEEQEEKEKEEKEEKDEDDEVFDISKKDTEKKPNYTKAITSVKDGVFKIDTNKQLESLPEQTKSMAKQENTEYHLSSRTTWIEKFMKNNNYDIVTTPGDGNCFFHAVRIAYQQMGYSTTIEQLRALLATMATEDTLETYQTLYQNVLAEIEDLQKETAKLKKDYATMKDRYTKTKDETLRKSINDLTDKYGEYKEELKLATTTKGEFAFMENVKTLDDLRKVIQTPIYWADDWAISVIERELKMKTIILSVLHYDSNDENNVLQCNLGSTDDKDIHPEFYVLLSHSGLHYNLISYKNRYIFKFHEIPYFMKTLVVIKCMERNAGVFQQIQDFRNFKSTLGIDDDDDTNENDKKKTMKGGDNGGEDTDTEFTFYENSTNMLAGKGQGEHLDDSKRNKYSKLNLKKFRNWRKMLDDSFVAPFEVDNMKWNTVTHYYQGSKFKKHHPDFYFLFSVGSNDEISTNVDFAIVAGSSSGVYSKNGKEVRLRPEHIKADADFYGERETEEREKALYAKFSQNEDLKGALLATKNAILKHYVKKHPSTIDISLMKIRQKLQT